MVVPEGGFIQPPLDIDSSIEDHLTQANIAF